MKRLSALAAGAALLLTATAVLATPSTGVTPVNLARGTSAAAYTITHAANREIMTQTLTFAPGATTGWHTHPGPVVVIVQSGTLSFWDSMDCALETYTAGQALVVPGAGMFDLARNNDATVPLVLVVTYYDVPVGGPQTIPASAQCTTTAGVPQDVGASGITPVTHARTLLASDLNIAGTAGTDLLIQQLTWAPGATTGWHSHPGPVTVSITSGTLDFQHADCTRTAYPAGTTLVDSGTTHEASSTTTTVVFATYTNVPVGGAPRIDQPAPACATVPSVAPAPASVAPPAPASVAPPAPASVAPRALPNTSTSDVAIGDGAGPIAGSAFLVLALIAGLVGLRWNRRNP